MNWCSGSQTALHRALSSLETQGRKGRNPTGKVPRHLPLQPGWSPSFHLFSVSKRTWGGGKNQLRNGHSWSVQGWSPPHTPSDPLYLPSHHRDARGLAQSSQMGWHHMAAGHPYLAWLMYHARTQGLCGTHTAMARGHHCLSPAFNTGAMAPSHLSVAVWPLPED